MKFVYSLFFIFSTAGITTIAEPCLTHASLFAEFDAEKCHECATSGSTKGSCCQLIYENSYGRGDDDGVDTTGCIQQGDYCFSDVEECIPGLECGNCRNDVERAGIFCTCGVPTANTAITDDSIDGVHVITMLIGTGSSNKINGESHTTPRPWGMFFGFLAVAMITTWKVRKEHQRRRHAQYNKMEQECLLKV